jgi:hypothetical protein
VTCDPVAVALGVKAKPNTSLTRDKFAEVVLPVPDPTVSLDEAQRFDHTDLQALDGFGLWREVHRVELAVALADRLDPWVLARLAAVRAEVARRRGGRS